MAGTGCDLTTVWAGQGELFLLVSNDQLDQALPAVDMVALELLWVGVARCPDKWSS